MATLFEVLRRPLVTEKATSLKENDKQVALEVAIWATKDQIRLAAQKLFKVDVLNVRTMVCRGKTKRVGKHSGKQRNWKKAILTVKEGADVDAFGFVATVPEEVREPA